MTLIHACAKQIKNFFIPSFCEFCKIFLEKDKIFCDQCMDLVRPVVSVPLKVTPSIEMPVFAISGYTPPIKPLILAKASSKKLASRQLGRLIWQRTPLSYQPTDFFIPIPLHWSRYAWRGYNQANVIAQELSKLSGNPTIEAVERVKRTPFLSSLAIEKRPNLVKGVFEIRPNCISKIQGKHIVIVDDLMTTGATLKNVAIVLLKGKPASLRAVVAARAI